MTYQKYLSVANSVGKPAKPIEFKTEDFPKESQIRDPKLLSNPEYDPPDLNELKVKDCDLGPHLYPGGETEGLTRLNRFICENNAKWVRQFEKPKTSPNSIKPSTTVLSPYLKFGCISPR